MAAQVVNTTLVGTLGRDAELGYTPSGSVNLKFSVATNQGKGDEKVTRWWNITVWGKQAENLQQYLTKGTQVLIIGRQTVREYVDKSGKERYALEISADTVQLLGSRQDADANVGNTPARAAATAKDDFAFPVSDDLDDVPF